MNRPREPLRIESSLESQLDRVRFWCNTWAGIAFALAICWLITILVIGDCQ